MTSSDFLNKIKEIVIDKEPEAKIILYGSRAKGYAKSDSDWDLLILINREILTQEIEQRITYPLYDLEFDTGEVISPLVYTIKEWDTKYKITPFYKNVMNEGQIL